ncbi:hypothetical protein [Paenibacillus alkalitolerans]|uniref:hypothetical protein n=1 Tax=Paenibacillus alkalitolerans TaxID=2799335 RepID=UPI0018F5B3BD|nr:hypothetical protein [Paenibacillus alkalitolerans]
MPAGNGKDRVTIIISIAVIVVICVLLSRGLGPIAALHENDSIQNRNIGCS